MSLVTKSIPYSRFSLEILAHFQNLKDRPATSQVHLGSAFWFSFPVGRLTRRKIMGKKRKYFQKETIILPPPPCRNIFFNINKIHWTIMLISLPTTIKSGCWLGREEVAFHTFSFLLCFWLEKKNEIKKANQATFKFICLSLCIRLWTPTFPWGFLFSFNASRIYQRKLNI